jgi:hypothetical protein
VPVIRLEPRLRRPLAEGRSFGAGGAYEEVKGRLHLAVDPGHPANRRITDLELAPRAADGRVHWSADVSLLAPVEPARWSGRALLDVVNRGNTVSVPNFNHATRPVFGPGADPDPPVDPGDGFLMRHGWVVLSCGWQADVPELPGLLRLHGPEARAPGGGPLTGPVWSQLQSDRPVTHMLLSDRGHRPYPAADPDEAGAVLTVQDQPDGVPTPVPRQRWRFARQEGGRVVPDPCHLWIEGGFEPGRLYRVAYTAVGAPVMGLALLTLRDAAIWLRHGSAAEGHPAPGAVRRVHAYGRSQTGRLLRTYAYEDTNRDEAGREALDGILANVAGGMRGEFNQRFGQHSKDRPQMMAHVYPSADVPVADPVTGRTDALHARLDARGSPLRCIYTNTSAEYHRGDASLCHTDPGGTADVEPGPRTRVYHFAGTEHGLGVWPPSDTQPAAADPTGTVDRSQHLRGVVDYARLLRACLVNLDRWVAEGLEPPPSQVPRLAGGTAVPPEALAEVFARLPGAAYPRHHPRPLRLDFGPDPARPDRIPPRVGPSFGSLVPAVDDDGNEIAGVAVPEVAVPLATHTGWNPRHSVIGGAEQLLVFAGATLPFPRTRAERRAAGDPRPSLEERYPSRAAYLARVRAAALALVAARHLLEEDVEPSVERAARMWDHWTGARP